MWGIFLAISITALVASLLVSQEDLVLTCNLKQVIFILQYTYTIHIMILSPIEIDRPSIENPSIWSFNIHDFYSSSRVIWIFILNFILFLDSISPIPSLGTSHSMLKLIAEIRIALQKRGDSHVPISDVKAVGPKAFHSSFDED